MIDHVTYHVTKGTLDRVDLPNFFEMLGFKEVRPGESPPEPLSIRWFCTSHPSGIIEKPLLHLVEGRLSEFGAHDQLALGHLCVGVGDRYDAIRAQSLANYWIDRDAGSGRFWLRYSNLRVEVRP